MCSPGFIHMRYARRFRTERRGQNPFAMFRITPEDPETPDARTLIDGLSDTLRSITGDSGRSSFDPADVRGEKALFVVARDGEGRAVGCGAFRPLQSGVAEVKRMYALPHTRGVGSAVLRHLEAQATAMGYIEFWLETRLVNTRAVAFYEKRGYARIARFGPYVDRPEAVCLGKRLVFPCA
jgi:ribosomal protein S18 acetylase RimI-like enzyme